MQTATTPDKLTFDTLPLSFLSLTEELFQDSLPSVAVLHLPAILQPGTETIERWLHTDERTQLIKFSFEKRSREWLGGRICAKQSLRLFLRSRQKSVFIPEHEQCCVQSEESGRPYFSAISGVNFTFPELSISHSKEYAAAMISSLPCGIDIQFTAENLNRVQEKFCTTDEKHLLQQELPQLPELSRLTLLWSGKEAAKKMLSPDGMPGFHELHLCKLSRQNRRDMILSFSVKETFPAVTVTATMMDNSYAAAICCAAKPLPGAR